MDQLVDGSLFCKSFCGDQACHLCLTAHFGPWTRRRAPVVGIRCQHGMDRRRPAWRSFRREMSWWVEQLDLEQSMKYNLAARWLLRQSGVVRQRGGELTPKELEAKKAVKGVDPADGREIVLEEADPL